MRIDPDDAGSGAPLTVFYDGGCPLCTREIRVMRRLDRNRRLAFLDVSRGQGAQGGVARDTLMQRFHVRRADGRMISGAAAFTAMWRELPALAGLGRWADRPAVQRVLEQAYRLFLRIRPRLQALARRLEGRGEGRAK